MRRIDAPIAFAAALICATAAFVHLPLVLSVLFAVPLVLVLPGYALLEALSRRETETAQRIVLVPALSVALDIAIALIVNFTSTGLTPRSWAVGLVCVIGLAAGVAWVRGPAGLQRPEPLRLRVRRLDVVVLVVAVAVVAATAVLVRTPLAASRAKGYTALSLVRSASSTVLVDVRSGELQPTRYRLVVQSPLGVAFSKKGFELEPGATLSARIRLPVPRSPVTATLYRANQTHAYRRVYLH
jgi:uncharacterized membrane protein